MLSTNEMTGDLDRSILRGHFFELRILTAELLLEGFEPLLVETTIESDVYVISMEMFAGDNSGSDLVRFLEMNH